jgi:hypothetical protein
VNRGAGWGRPEAGVLAVLAAALAGAWGTVRAWRPLAGGSGKSPRRARARQWRELRQSRDRMARESRRRNRTNWRRP